MNLSPPFWAAFSLQSETGIKPAMAKRKEKPNPEDLLKGWAEIAEFLELPVSTAHRFAKEGMPVSRQRRYVVASRDELMQWVGTDRAGRPSAIVNNATDLSAELKRSLKGLGGKGLSGKRAA
jgi:hypothetical protein